MVANGFFLHIGVQNGVQKRLPFDRISVTRNVTLTPLSLAVNRLSVFESGRDQLDVLQAATTEKSVLRNDVARCDAVAWNLNLRSTSSFRPQADDRKS